MPEQCFGTLHGGSFGSTTLHGANGAGIVVRMTAAGAMTVVWTDDVMATPPTRSGDAATGLAGLEPTEAIPGVQRAGSVDLAYTPHYGSWLNRIEAQFKALRYLTLDGTDHPDHATPARLIRRYIARRNHHADDTRLRAIVNTANVA